MRLSTKIFGAATLVGIGVYMGKKLIENKNKKDDDRVIVAEGKETYGDKFHKASMFAIGAVKTSADKIAEGIKEIKVNDMVKKGEEAVDQAKEAAGQIKKDIDDLKNMVVSINVSVGEDDENIEEEEEKIDLDFVEMPVESSDNNETKEEPIVHSSYEDVMETEPSDIN